MPENEKAKLLMCSYCYYHGSDFKNKSHGLYECPYCNSLLDFGFSADEQNLLSNAQSLLRRQKFDDAEAAFLDIIEQYPKNHEAYWGYICAKYGIKHEEDYNGKIIPTCCLDSIDSFKDDPAFQKALKYAPDEIEKQYKEEGAYIERISKEWEEKAKKEKPYDIFISFKDSDKENGIERTQDSFEAGELYAWLTNQGYNVFFSRISLADKAGEKYEPYIFNALQTAKILIVFGSSPEYIQSTWVKNEWHRFCKRIAQGEKKDNSLLVVYHNFQPSDLPSILSAKQCLDYHSNRFYDDLRSYLDSFFKENKAAEEAKGSKKNATSVVKNPNKAREEAEHKHKYSENVVPASCIAKGYTLYTCECGDEYKDKFTPFADHNYKELKTRAATCTEAGYRELVCKECGEKKKESFDPLGHSFSAWTRSKRDPSKEERMCSRCGKTEKRNVVSLGDVFKACTEMLSNDFSEHPWIFIIPVLVISVLLLIFGNPVWTGIGIVLVTAFAELLVAAFFDEQEFSSYIKFGLLMAVTLIARFAFYKQSTEWIVYIGLLLLYLISICVYYDDENELPFLGILGGALTLAELIISIFVMPWWLSGLIFLAAVGGVVGYKILVED